MPSNKVTAAEVAKLAGVSQSAVSRVYTPGASASQDTVAKVHRAAETLGYRPNVLARAMASGRTKIIGLVVAYLGNYYYPEAVEQLTNALQEQGYHVLMFMAKPTLGDIDALVEDILDYQVDGLIAVSVATSSTLSDRCKKAGVPVVFFNRTQYGSGLNTVVSDNIKAGRDVADFFAAAGHRKVGYIAGWEGASTQRDREAGFIAGLAEHGLGLHARELGNFRADHAKEAARRMFDCADPPDCVFVCNDYMAVSVIDVLRNELRLDVPEDVSVVGFDDAPVAALGAYALTTMKQRTDQMVSAAVELLLASINEADYGARTISIDAPLVLRSSARIPEGWKDERA